MTQPNTGNGSPVQSDEKKDGFSFASFLITFILMFITWVVLSGNFSGLLISLGIVSSLLVAWFFNDLLFPSVTTGHIRIFIKFTTYIPWLIWEIIKANFHLLYIVFHPRMKELIDPHIVTFKTDLKSDLAITTLANSITLTPGTITVNAVREGMFRVHAIDKPSADALPGAMLEKTADIYGEEN
ncbi:MAG: Na+/H+ antiporter subunit E [Desulfobacterales bacterium]|nr:Na+/H+ antiporter subunit E [Desulfobacterales bacterium]